MRDLRTMELGSLYAFVISEEAVRDARRLLEEASDSGGPTTLPSLRGSEGRARSILELEGLGKEIWQGVDPKDYIRELRDEWDHR